MAPTLAPTPINNQQVSLDSQTCRHGSAQSIVDAPLDNEGDERLPHATEVTRDAGFLGLPAAQGACPAPPPTSVN
jgi:hypothetical protein